MKPEIRPYNEVAETTTEAVGLINEEFDTVINTLLDIVRTTPDRVQAVKAVEASLEGINNRQIAAVLEFLTEQFNRAIMEDTIRRLTKIGIGGRQ